MKTINHGKFLKIGGINHNRYVGIVRVGQFEGQAFDFFKLNVDNYRPAQNIQEREACIEKAKQYYLACFPTTTVGEFSTSEETVEEKVAETQEEYDQLCKELDEELYD